MGENPRVVAITAAMLEGTSLADVKESFPDRVFDVGICEEHATTFAAGLSAGGLQPVIGVYSTFLQRAFDQLIHDVCLQDLPVVIAIDRAGIVGDDGKTHQGIFDLSYLGLIPNLRVAAPRDGHNLQDMLYSALKVGHPVAIRYPRGVAADYECDQAFSIIPEGKAEVLRSGDDLTLLAVGTVTEFALEAARILSGRGIEASVIDARWVKPLDEAAIMEAGRRTRRVVTIEENVLAGGFGSSVTRLLSERLPGVCEVRNLGIPDIFVEHASQDSLRHRFGLDGPSIAGFVIGAFIDLKRKSEGPAVAAGKLPGGMVTIN
jgi:1-deoxy-D-xylulose-5-phosphate synthase